MGPQTLGCGPLAAEQMETWPLRGRPSVPFLTLHVLTGPRPGLSAGRGYRQAESTGASQLPSRCQSPRLCGQAAWAFAAPGSSFPLSKGFSFQANTVENLIPLGCGLKKGVGCTDLIGPSAGQQPGGQWTGTPGHRCCSRTLRSQTGALETENLGPGWKGWARGSPAQRPPIPESSWDSINHRPISSPTEISPAFPDQKKNTRL